MAPFLLNSALAAPTHQQSLALSPRDDANPSASTTSDTSSPVEASPSFESTITTTTESGGNSGTSKSPNMAVAANYGAPRCKSAALFDLCTSSNAEAYCDGVGFHCNFMTSCKGVCWCE